MSTFEFQKNIKMKNKFMRTGILMLVMFASNAFVQGQDAKEWKVDKTHASVNFSINHFFSEVTGKFQDFDGAINFDKENLKASKAEFTIQIKSVDTDEADRDGHLQSADFFDAATYPTMKFVSSSFKKVDDSNYMIAGKMTIKDVTKAIELPMKITGMMDNPWSEGKVILGVKIETSINRTEYGIGTGSWAATAVVGDDVAVKVVMELDGAK
jgi:polyisoprenoid-binding protein YceI